MSEPKVWAGPAMTRDRVGLGIASMLLAVAVVAPFDYTALIWGTAIGWLVWHELPGAHVWLGAGVVVASGLYIIHREARVRR